MKVTDEMLFEHAAAARDIWLATLPADEDIPEIKCSRAFERKMKNLIKEQRRSPKTAKILRVIKQTVAAVLVFATVSFAGLMTVEAYRAKFIEMIVQVFHDFTSFDFVSEGPDISEIELPEVSFAYIPEGMQETENRTVMNYRRYVLYENEAGQFFEFTQRAIGANGVHTSIIDTEDAEYGTIFIQGNEGFYNQKGGDTLIMWTNDSIVYRLRSNIELRDLKKIAEKIKIIEK